MSIGLHYPNPHHHVLISRRSGSHATNPNGKD
jgi:hypothetical protein